MPMNCRLKCEKPDDIEYTLTVTMPAGDWGKLRDQMHKVSYAWPTCDLIRQIDDLLSQARKIYWPKSEPEKVE